ncbi:MAG: DUF262 domain-containing protein [Cytophagales bacterium]|jgi:hypothetical protein|nr:DUF262 domain-containing protein [Cytophagales bacterium]MCA6423977.1 DUF262 domain-containing protein [Flavobacterium sp.]MCA6438228.1 DUF262 domain-containing protein [Bacteroidota bacterium]MCA6493054.1 DUF262 domain-containing protein [Chitinophagaceae bacterium]MCA6427105.1 DUF262 domain-containing protein [Cytophagales bacterium]
MKRQPSTQQISWFLDLERNTQLDLNPPYQRKSVWSPKDRRFFLDTIFRNYPTPPIFVHWTIDDNGFTMYHIVDGKQRLETILGFAKNKIAIYPNYGDVNFDGKKFSELDVDQKRKFWDYTLVVDFIESVDGANIDQVFDRVNRNPINMQPQELRHARFNGWFINETEDEAENDFWWNIKVSTRAKDKRMKNVQLIAELLLIILDKKIVGFNQDYLDDMFALYDSPEESVDTFDEEAYKIDRNRIKTYLTEMEAHNSCISTYAKTANNLYTLWALVALNAVPAAATLADSYTAFMTQVGILAAAENPEALVPDNAAPMLQKAFTYYRNSKGASTDLTQRNERLNSLKSVLPA